MRSLHCILIALVVLAVAVASPTQADPVTLLVEKATDEAAAAVADPGAQATPEAVQEDADWGVAYGCHLGATVEDESGVDAPDLEQCHAHDEVIGIAPEEEPDVAIVEPADKDAEAVVVATVEDASATAVAIVEDPEQAPGEASGLATRLVDRLLGFLDIMGAGLAFGAGTAWSGVVAIGDGIVAAVLFVVAGTVAAVVAGYEGLLGGALLIGRGFALVGSTLYDGAAAIGGGVVWGLSATWEATVAVATGTADLIGDAVDGVLRLFAEDAPAATRGATDAAGDLKTGTDAVGLDLPLDVSVPKL